MAAIASPRVLPGARHSVGRARKPAASAVAHKAARGRANLRVNAMLGGTPPGADKKFISREEEPDEYWSSKGEKAGSNPLKDPLAIIGIIAILFPFLFVLVAIGTGAIDTSVYRGN